MHLSKAVGYSDLIYLQRLYGAASFPTSCWEAEEHAASESMHGAQYMWTMLFRSLVAYRAGLGALHIVVNHDWISQRTE